MASRAELDFDRLLAEVNSSQDESVLSALMRFAGRPGNAIRAALAGDLPAAAKNVGQFALDLPTGGFLNRSLSLGNLVSDTGDITKRRERYTTEDVLKAHGQAIPSDPKQRLVLGLVGDMATDPLTYLTFGGGGLAKGALAKLPEAVTASRLYAAMGGTNAGKAALAGVRGADDAEGIARVLGVGREALAGMDDAAEANLIASAVKRGLIEDRGALRFMGKPIVSDVWSKVGKATAPGALREAGKRFAPDFTAKVDNALADAWNYAGRTFLDNTIAGRTVPHGSAMRRKAQEGAIVAGAKKWEWEQTAQKVAKLVPDPARREELGRRLHEASDAFQAGGFGQGKAARAKLAEQLQAVAEEGLAPNEVQALKLYQGAIAKDREALRASGLWSRVTPVWDAEDGAASFVRAKEAAESALASVQGGDAKAVRRARRALRRAEVELKAYHDSIRLLAEKAPKTRKKAERLLKRRTRVLSKHGLGLEFDDPFHVTRQLKDEVAERMPRGVNLGAAKAGVKTAVLKRRDYATVEQWADAVIQAARKEGVAEGDLAGLADELVREGATLKDVAELDLAKLSIRYGEGVGTSLGRKHLLNFAEELGLKKKDPRVENYLNQVWGGAGPRPAVQRWLAAFNRKFKPAQTVIWPSYHARNLVGAIFQTALDPDLNTLDGLTAAARTVSDLPAVKLSKELGASPDDMVAFMRAAEGDEAAIQLVRGKTIGGRPGSEVLDALVGGVLSQGGGHGDLFDSMSMLEKIGQPDRTAKVLPAQVYDTWKRWGYSTAGYVENTMRTHAYLKLIGKGVDPVDAVTRVNRVFVKYDQQSKADRVLRDAFPFIRWQLAMTPVAVEAMARRPGSLSMQALRQAQVQSERQDSEEQLGLPDYVRRGLRVPLGGGEYIGSMGLPQEAAAQFLEIPLGTEQFGQSMAGLATPIRLPLERGLGKSFFTGAPWGSNRQAPPLARYIPGLTKTFTAKDGETYTEVPGWINELLRAFPTSRGQSVVEAIADSEKGDMEKIGRLVFGVPTLTTDQRRGVARAVARHMSRLYAQGKVGEAKQHWARVAEGEEVPEGLAEAVRAEVSLRKGK